MQVNARVRGVGEGLSVSPVLRYSTYISISMTLASTGNHTDNPATSQTDRGCIYVLPIASLVGVACVRARM